MSSTGIPKLILKKNRESSVLRYHPWIFSGAVYKVEGQPADGDLAEVYDSSNRFLCLVHYQQGSITGRVISYKQENTDLVFWKSKINAAIRLRKSLGLLNNPSTNAYRLIHGEGDFCPGLIIDVYNDVAVIQPHSSGMARAVEVISQAVSAASGGKIRHVYVKNPSGTGFGTEGFIVGGGIQEVEILENDCRFRVNFTTGQKTGFFLDQRENRLLLGRYSKDRKVLNTFCYTGGFSVYAAKGKAALVDSVDSSELAISLATANMSANTEAGFSHQEIVANAVGFIEQTESRYDLIVLDPPAFAKHLSARHNALKAYKRINTEAIKRINPGGIIFTFSCSQVIDRDMFRGAVHSAAIESGRSVRILHQLSQPGDHPINIYHPEGEYLKGLVLSVD